MNVNERRTIFIYEACRIHAICLDCPVIPKPWEFREPEFKAQFVELISDLCSGRRKFLNPKEAHDSWVRKYKDMGWSYGEIYCPQRKLHPDLVPYEELDPKEKVKDEVFMELVQLAKSSIW